MSQHDVKGRAGEITLGTPDPMRLWWGFALVSPIAVAIWLACSAAPGLACIALVTVAGLEFLRRRFRASSGLGTFCLDADGGWVVRNGEFEAAFTPIAITPWPGAILVDFAIDGVRYAMAISARSAGAEAFRRMQVRVRAAPPGHLA